MKSSTEIDRNASSKQQERKNEMTGAALLYGKKDASSKELNDGMRLRCRTGACGWAIERKETERDRKKGNVSRERERKGRKQRSTLKSYFSINDFGDYLRKLDR